MDKQSKKEAISGRLVNLSLTQTSAAQMIGIAPQQFNAYICGRKKFGREAALKWSKTFGFNPNWLMYDEEPMLKEQAAGVSVINNISKAGRDSIVGSTVVTEPSAELLAENAALKAENKHLKDIIAEKEARIEEKERTIGILLGKN